MMMRTALITGTLTTLVAWFGALAPPPEADCDDLAPSETSRPIQLCIDALALPMKDRMGYDDSLIPPEIRGLDFQRVEMIGTMSPSFQQHGIERFLFNGGTRGNSFDYRRPNEIPVQCYIGVTMRMGEATEYRTQFIAVTGRFRIKPVINDEGKLLLLYHLEDATVKPSSNNGLRRSVGTGC